MKKLAVATGLEKISFHSNPEERQCQTIFKLPRIAHISYTSKVMLRILQARFQQNMNCELLDVQADLEKADEPEIKLSTFVGS